ncbi:MAG: hypothetical protein QXF56_01670 [Candidatus Micrarchaeia archaeon]
MVIAIGIYPITGYIVVKKFRLDIASAALGVAIGAFLGISVSTVIHLILTLGLGIPAVGLKPSAYALYPNAGVKEITDYVLFEALDTAFTTVVGAVLAAIGAAVAKALGASTSEKSFVFGAAILPICALVVVFTIKELFSLLFHKFAILLCFGEIAMWWINIVVYVWTGYNAAKKFGANIISAAFTGTVVGFIATSIDGIIRLVLIYALLVMMGPSPFAQEVVGITGEMTLFFFVGVSIAVIIMSAVGTVLAAIGGVLGGAMRK